MTLGRSVLLALNRIFPPPPHPFNLAVSGEMTYAEWQFHRGGETLAFYRPCADESQILRGKRVLDIGCGAGGKTLYYATRGAAQVTGIEVVPGYVAEAEALSDRLGLREKTTFVVADAGALPFAGGAFDTIIANDVMEHVRTPERVLAECHRVLAAGGRMYANFPPLYHPYGAHLSDAIGVPWAHVFFREKTLIDTYKDLVRGLPDGTARIALRFGRNREGRETITYINRMTLARFDRILAGSPFRVAYRRHVPLRPHLRLPARLWPEFFVRMAVFVLEKV